ncbi:MAG: FHA domain-containing protein [Anaerolineae bacterium]|nr:FHA domain-containing protein [Anaerolineae bacterium]MBN8619690.1 FHA domain-containing protein [Anaerolineae bacterium]
MQQGNDNFRLVVRRGPQPNQVYELNKDIITIGRDITNDITINDPEVSRHHLRFTRGAGGFTLEDLGSTNGTFVNGQRLTGAKPLNNGDLIGLGETVTLGYEMLRAIPGAGPIPGSEFAPTAANPVQRQPQQPAAPAAPYNPYAPQQPAQQQPAYGSAPAQQPQPAYQQQPAGYNPPPPPGGYEYDPYAVREEEPRSMTRWIVIGCVGLSLLCCCGTIAALFLVDTLCLWDSLPILGDLVRAIGWSVTC